MRGEEKEEEMRELKKGEKRIMVEKKVIEVGVEVKDEKIIVIENEESLGM